MAGHSKWANIKHRKGAQDKKRGKIFTRLLKEIQVAAKEGDPNIENNPRLRLAVQQAKKNNVPKDTIEKAISKGAGGGGEDFNELTYEGYATNGVAVFIEAMTDNLNRTVANVRSYFTKHGGSLATNGSVDFLFERKGVFTLKNEGQDVDELTLELIDAGLEEVEVEGDILVLTCPFTEFGNLNAKLEEMGIESENSELQRIPTTTVKLGVEDAQKVLALIDKIEDDDDVQQVFHNLEMTDELMAALTE